MDNHQGMAAKAGSIQKQHLNVQFEKIQDCLREFQINLHFTKLPVIPNHFLEYNRPGRVSWISNGSFHRF
jgi:hypothetical protein